MTNRVLAFTTADTRSRLAKEYLEAKRFAESTAKRADELKKVLKEDVTANGVPDEKGNMWCPAGDFQLKHERRVSTNFDIAAATAWAKSHGFWDDIKEVVEVTSEDKLLALGWKHPDLNDDIQSFYVQKESWAFKVVEQKSYDDE